MREGKCDIPVPYLAANRDCTDEVVCVHNAGLHDAARTLAVAQGLGEPEGPQLFERRPSWTLRSPHYFVKTYHHTSCTRQRAPGSHYPH